jgi:hypothetical protein
MASMKEIKKIYNVEFKKTNVQTIEGMNIEAFTFKTKRWQKD